MDSDFEPTGMPRGDKLDFPERVALAQELVELTDLLKECEIENKIIRTHVLWWNHPEGVWEIRKRGVYTPLKITRSPLEALRVLVGETEAQS